MTANDRHGSGRTAVGVLASGRGSNLLALLEAQDEGQLEAALRVVISDVPTAPALEHARRHGVEALHLPPGPFKTRLGEEEERAYVRAFRDRGVELVVLAGFMRVVHRPFFEAYRGRIINIHPSLLPSFPGLKAQRQALEHGVKVSGCTVHFVEEKVDAGPIIAQVPVAVLEGDTEETLSARILEEEHRLIVEAVNLVAGRRAWSRPA
jgi:phosphoribosylglycinamide formyltransferase-1